MTKIIASEFLTLDGVMGASETWQPPYVTDDVAAEISSHINNADGSMFGRLTYDMFVQYWPMQTNNEYGIADKLNSEPKYVVSSTLENADWNNTTVLRDIGDIRELKEQPGGYLRLVGSAMLAQSLMRAGLIDEYWLLVHPLVRGTGKRLFDDSIDKLALKVIEAKPFSSGVVLMRYQPEYMQ
jgi:dihydrofolate reductase